MQNKNAAIKGIEPGYVQLFSGKKNRLGMRLQLEDGNNDFLNFKRKLD